MAPDDSTIQEIGKGIVLLWNNFEFFESGEKKDSRFLILSSCHPQYKSFLAVRATTKTGFFNRPSKMTREFLIVPDKSEIPLPKKSVIYFNNMRTLVWSDMKPIWDNEVKKMGFVSDGLLDQVDKLVNVSKTVRKDWRKWILESPRQNK